MQDRVGASIQQPARSPWYTARGSGTVPPASVWHGRSALIPVLLAVVLLICWTGAVRAQGQPESVPTLAPLPTEQAVPLPSSTRVTAPAGNASAGTSADDGDWFQRRFVDGVSFLLSRITTPLQTVVSSEWNNPTGFILHTGPQITYNNKTVLGYWGVLRSVANLALVLIAMWGGFSIILRDSIGAEYYGAMQLLPRLVLGALMVNTSPWFIKLLIDLNNALCSLVGQLSPPGWDAAGELQRTLMGLILWLVLLGLLLVFQLVMLFRLAMLNFLIVLSPLASLCWILPQTQGYARSWMRNFVGTVFSQFLQVLALSLTVSLLGALEPMSSHQALSEVLVAIAMMFVVFKAPSLLSHHDHGGWIGGLVGYTAVRSVTGRIGSRSAERARSTGSGSMDSGEAG